MLNLGLVRRDESGQRAVKEVFRLTKQSLRRQENRRERS